MPVLAGYITKALGYEPHRYEYREETGSLFLYHALEELIWNALSRRLSPDNQSREAIQKHVDQILAESPDLGWFPIEEAILSCKFVPCGFKEAEVFGGDQKLIGRTLITWGGGLAYPEVISSDSDWVALICYIMGCKPCNPDVIENVDSPHAYIVVPGKHAKIRWVKIENSQMSPGGDILQYRKPSEVVSVPEGSKSTWVNDYFLELEPVCKWDEGAPDIMAIFRAAANGKLPHLVNGFDQINLAYVANESPVEIIRMWQAIAKRVAEYVGQVDLGIIVAKTLGLPTLPASGSRLEDLFSVMESSGCEGFEAELKGLVTAKGRSMLLEREKQMAESGSKYPHLALFSNQALTYWWRKYISETESQMADVANDERYSVASREFDENFIFYLVLKATENYGDISYIFMDINPYLKGLSRTNSAPAIDLALKSRIKGAVLLQSLLMNTQSSEDIPDIINDWRLHINRVLSIAVAASSIADICIPFETRGPKLFSESDEHYCAVQGVRMSLSVPRK